MIKIIPNILELGEGRRGSGIAKYVPLPPICPTQATHEYCPKCPRKYEKNQTFGKIHNFANFLSKFNTTLPPSAYQKPLKNSLTPSPPEKLTNKPLPVILSMFISNPNPYVCMYFLLFQLHSNLHITFGCIFLLYYNHVFLILHFVLRCICVMLHQSSQILLHMSSLIIVS